MILATRLHGSSFTGSNPGPGLLGSEELFSSSEPLYLLTQSSLGLSGSFRGLMRIKVFKGLSLVPGTGSASQIT